MRQITRHFTVLILTIAALLFSCSTTTERKDDEVDERLGNWANQVNDKKYAEILKHHLDNKFIENDTLLLGYVLGWNRIQVDEHTNELISKSIIAPKRQQKITIYTTRTDKTYSTDIDTWKGFDFSFQSDPSTNCKGFINYAFEGNSLAYLRLFITDNPNFNALEKFIERKYGKPMYAFKKFKSEYDAYPSQTYIWLSGGKEIQLNEWDNYSFIQYSNAKLRYENEIANINAKEAEIKQDSLEKLRRKNEAEQSHKSF